jgi:hypothetical protein
MVNLKGGNRDCMISDLKNIRIQENPGIKLGREF